MINCFKISTFFLLIWAVVLPFFGGKEIKAEEKSRRETVYQPEDKKKETADSQRTPGSTRGENCNLLPPEIVTLIVPENHIGKTVSARPTVIWYLKQDISQTANVTITAPWSKPILVENFEGLSQGFTAFTIPDNNPGLEIGKPYKITLTIVCNEKNPAKNLYAYTWIKRVPEFSETNSENSNCAVDFAQLGIWYDAIYCSYSRLNLQESYSAFPEEDFNALLEQVNLSELKIDLRNTVQNLEL